MSKLTSYIHLIGGVLPAKAKAAVGKMRGTPASADLPKPSGKPVATVSLSPDDVAARPSAPPRRLSGPMMAAPFLGLDALKRALGSDTKGKSAKRSATTARPVGAPEAKPAASRPAAATRSDKADTKAAVAAERARCAAIVAHGVRQSMDAQGDLSSVIAAASFAFDSDMSVEAATRVLDSHVELVKLDRKASRRWLGQRAYDQAGASQQRQAEDTAALVANARAVYDSALGVKAS